MGTVRRILCRHRRLALLLIVLALAIKALVPAGYMVGAGHQILTVTICADVSGAQLTREIEVPRRGATDDNGVQHAKGTACPVTALAMVGTAGADPLLLALAFAFILAIGLAPLVIPTPSARARLRPPLRGPPILAQHA